MSSEKWDKDNPRVPFEVTGKWVTVGNNRGYDERVWQKDPVQLHLKMMDYPLYHSEFVDLPNFHARLKLVETTRGRTAATSWWRDTTTGVLYPVSFKALSDIIQRANLTAGETDLYEWKAMKRGSNYCIGLV